MLSPQTLLRVRGSHFASKVSYIKPCGRVFNIEILKVSVYDMAASGFVRTFGGGLRRSTVAHFACKVRGTNIVAAKHAQKNQQGHAPDFATCPSPSLCLQSEGDEYSGGQARAKKSTRSCPRLRHMSVPLTLLAK